MNAKTAQAEACSKCGAPSAPASSYCVRCGAGFAVEARIALLRLDHNNQPLVATAGGIGDCAAPWAMISDDRSIYLFERNNTDELRIRRLAAGRDGETLSADLGVAAKASEVRGVAATRRGAFIVTADTLTGALAPRAVGGAWTRTRSIIRDAEIVGVAGLDRHLLLASLEGNRLTLRQGSGDGPPPVVAAMSWERGAPGWLRIYANPEAGLVWLWGAGALLRVDLALGEMTFSQNADAPVSVPTSAARREIAVRPATPRPQGYADAAPAPLRNGDWGVLDLRSGKVFPLPAEHARPLAFTALTERRLLALFPSHALHVEVDGGGLKLHRGNFGPVLDATVTGGERTAVVWALNADRTLCLFELTHRRAAPPSLKSERQVRPSAESLLSALSPSVMDGRVYLAAPIRDGLGLWTCEQEPA